MSDLDAVLDALTAERYGRPLWWRTPEGQHPSSAPDAVTDWDDSELTVARRRRDLLAAVSKRPEKEAM